MHGIIVGKAERVLFDGFSTIVCTNGYVDLQWLMEDSFFEHADKISSPWYIPTAEDVLRARTKTTGIYETRFSMGSLSIQSVTLLQGFGGTADMR